MHLIVVPKLSGGWQHICSSKTRQAGWANEQYIYSRMSIEHSNVSMCVGIAKCLKNILLSFLS